MTRAQSSFIPAFLVLCQIFCVVSGSQQCRDEYSFYGMMLKRHIFNKTKASSWSACVQACNDDIRCQSMNYVISQGTCELNNRTKEARPENFVPHEKRAYMKRFTKRGITLFTPEILVYLLFLFIRLFIYFLFILFYLFIYLFFPHESASLKDVCCSKAKKKSV